MSQPIGVPEADSGTEATSTEGVDGGDDHVEIDAPAANNWWQFADKDAAESWAKNLVTKRLSRDRKTNLEPLQQTNATLEAEVARLKPFEEAAMTDAEKRDAREAALAAEIEELRTFKAQTSRQGQVNEIATEIGLPASMVKFITGEDEAAIRESATDLLNALSEGGSNTGKRTPTPKAPKGDAVPAGDKASSGGGGNNGEPTDEEMIALILEETAKIRKNGGLSFR